MPAVWPKPNKPIIHDISVTLQDGLASWPGEDFWRLEPVARMAKGDPCNVSRLAMGAHFGTHVDAPWHFGGTDRTVEAIELTRLVTHTRVLDLTHVEKAISAADLAGKLGGVDSVIFKTRNSGKLAALEPFDTEFIHLASGAADAIVEAGIRTVGVDYLSVEGYHASDAPVHHRLLGAEVFIVEGLDLSAVDEGEYQLIVLPLKIAGCDGAPARAILVEPPA